MTMGLLLFTLLPLTAWGQQTKKALVMNVVRVSGGPISTVLWPEDDFVGPVLNMQTNRLQLSSTSLMRSRIKEIRFEIQDVEIPDVEDGVKALETEDGRTDAIAYDLQGRRVNPETMGRGIYIIKGKKYVKR